MPADDETAEHAAPYYPPQAEAAEMADLLTAFADRYPLMWPTTRRKMVWASESLRFQVRHGYVSAPTAALVAAAALADAVESIVRPGYGDETVILQRLSEAFAAYWEATR